MAEQRETIKYGGQVSKHYKFWTTFCCDRNVLRHVGGITIPFTKTVKQVGKVSEIKMNENEKMFVQNKLQQLIDTGCIVPLKRKCEGWVSNIFL